MGGRKWLWVRPWAVVGIAVAMSIVGCSGSIDDDPDLPGDDDDDDVADPLDSFFGTSGIAEIHVDLDDQDWASLLAEPREYVDASVTIDGTAFPSVGVRL